MRRTSDPVPHVERYAAIIAATLCLLVPTWAGAQSVEQPREAADKSSCDSAWNRNDYPTIVSACGALAQDYSRDGAAITDVSHAHLQCQKAVHMGDTLLQVSHAQFVLAQRDKAMSTALLSKRVLSTVASSCADGEIVYHAKKGVDFAQQWIDYIANH